MNVLIEDAPKGSKEVCQYCKWHHNNPSFCKGLNMYVGRKKTCLNFRKA